MEYFFRGFCKEDNDFWYSDLFLNLIEPKTNRRFSLYNSPITLSNLELYTRLNDINDIKIWAGDIVSVCIDNKTYFNLEIVWDEDCARFNIRGRYEYSSIIYPLTCDTILDYNVTVIGNIHQNVKLLSGKE